MVDIPEDDATLLAECDVQAFRAGGPGGQHQNTTDSAVRLVHRPTGVTVVCRRHRSQHLNKAECLRRLRDRLAELDREPAVRKPTAPTRSAIERRLAEKKRRSRKKESRRPPEPED